MKPSLPRIKVCGVRTPEHAAAAAAAGASAVGLVFADRSPRRLTPDEAASVAAAVPPFVERVGLFTDHDAAAIRRIAANLPLSLIQLHGEYDAGTIDALAPLRVLRAVHFNPDTAADTLRYWDETYRELENLAGLLIDTPDPNRRGGTGRSFDWNALRAVLDEVNPAVPLVLAGGLHPGNVAAAVQTVRPWAVDVSSGVESSPGVKDPEKIHAFCQAVRVSSL